MIGALMYIMSSLHSGTGGESESDSRVSVKTIVFDLALVLLMALSFWGMKPVYGHYEHVSGKEIPEGMPKTLWIAMGLQDGIPDRGCGTNGWYNGYSVETFRECGFDPELSDKAARAYIEKRLLYFKDNPGEGISFFKEKVITSVMESFAL